MTLARRGRLAIGHGVKADHRLIVEGGVRDGRRCGEGGHVIHQLQHAQCTGERVDRLAGLQALLLVHLEPFVTGIPRPLQGVPRDVQSVRHAKAVREAPQIGCRRPRRVQLAAVCRPERRILAARAGALANTGRRLPGGQQLRRRRSVEGFGALLRILLVELTRRSGRRRDVGLCADHPRTLPARLGRRARAERRDARSRLTQRAHGICRAGRVEVRGSREATVHVLVEPIEALRVQVLGAMVDGEGQTFHLRRVRFARMLGPVPRHVLFKGFEALLERHAPLLRGLELRLERNAVSDLGLHLPHDVCLLTAAIALVKAALVRVHRGRRPR